MCIRDRYSGGCKRDPGPDPGGAGVAVHAEKISHSFEIKGLGVGVREFLKLTSAGQPPICSSVSAVAVSYTHLTLPTSGPV